MSIRKLAGFLPGELSGNDHVLELIKDKTESMGFYVNFMNGIFDGLHYPGMLWNKSDWFCEFCVLAFFRGHFFPWLIDHLKSGTQEFIIIIVY